MGRALQRLTKRHYKKVATWAAEGATRESMARGLGVSRATFYRWIEKDEALKEALQVGDAEDFQICQSVLRKKGIEGSFNHLAGYMRLSHKVNIADSSSQGAGGIQVVVNMPHLVPNFDDLPPIEGTVERIE